MCVKKVSRLTAFCVLLLGSILSSAFISRRDERRIPPGTRRHPPALEYRPLLYAAHRTSGAEQGCFWRTMCRKHCTVTA